MRYIKITVESFPRSVMARDIEPIEQAISGRDYVAIQTTIDMTDGVTRVPVEVTILSVRKFCYDLLITIWS